MQQELEQELKQQPILPMKEVMEPTEIKVDVCGRKHAVRRGEGQWLDDGPHVVALKVLAYIM